MSQRCAVLLLLLAGCRSWEAEDSGMDAPVALAGSGAQVDVGSDGLHLTNARERIGLVTVGWGREDATVAQYAAPPREAGCWPGRLRLQRIDCAPTIERDLDGGVERWARVGQGVEQGWTLDAAPPGTGVVEIDVAVSGADLTQDGGSVLLDTPGGGRWTYGALHAWDDDGVPLSAWMGVDGDTIRILIDDTDATWPLHVDPVLATASAILAEVSYDFGIGLALGGDVNDDGYADVLVGARFGTGLYGAAFSYHGSASGVSTTASQSWLDDSYYGKYGEYVDNRGDVNGDGYADAVVGEPYSDAIHIYHGSASGLGSAMAATASGIGGLGRDVAFVGDVNNDGYDDVVAAASYTIGAYVFRGSASGLNTTAVLSRSTTNAPSVARAGDVNSDGYDDVVYGDEGANAVYVVKGASAFPGATTTLTRSGSSSFGYDVTGGGDFNGDGYDDIAVGDPVYSSSTGRVTVFYGASSGVSSANYATLAAPVSGSGFGESVQWIGDINADGYDDIAVGDDIDHNYVYIFHGSASGIGATPVNSIGVSGVFGFSIGGGGDLNADGYDDVAISDYGNQTVYVYQGCADADNDGACAPDDCNDANAAIKPGATEVCDGVDNDCDGLTDGADSGLSAASETIYYRDADGDGFGLLSTTSLGCSAPSGYVAEHTDCNDGAAAVHPGATEVCNGIDDDCDAQVDTADSSLSAASETTYYRDADGDTYGSATTTTLSCTVPSGYVVNHTDCNDGVAAVNPGATEICDGIDNDCDTQLDSADSSISAASETTYYRDADGDTYGSATVTILSCSLPSGYVTNHTDCDDGAAAVNPAATEVCDGVDNDCDAQLDSADGSISAASETTYYRDADGDTYGSATVTTLSCSLPSGYVTTDTDCDDGAAAVNPAATEVCDGVDNDCDAQIDSADSSISVGSETTYYRDADGDTYGASSVTTLSCSVPSGYVADPTDCDDGAAAVNPAAVEVCNGIDDDCDGVLDSADSSIDVTSETLYHGDSDSDGYGSATVTVLSCSLPSGYVVDGADCDDTQAAINPAAAEVCDGVDNDCDGALDAADGSIDVGTLGTFYADGDGDGTGDPSSVTLACSVPVGYVSDATDCDDNAAAIHPAALEVCDGVDNDCDTLVDDADGSISADSETVWYHDADTDGYGAASDTTLACSQPDGYLTDATDCDDTSAAISPASPEGPGDGVDSDCSGTELCFVDGDEDGYRTDATRESTDISCTGPGDASRGMPDGDCDDNNATVFPGAEEIVDGIDNDCDGHDESWGEDSGGGDTDTGETGDSGDSDTGEDAPTEKGGCGCAESGSPLGSLGWLLALAPAALLRRRAR